MISFSDGIDWRVVGIIIFVLIVLGFLCAWFLQVLFNWVMPVFGVTAMLTYWQACGLCVFLGLLGAIFHRK